MGKSSPYHHYMQRVDINNEGRKDLENDFPGLLYMKADGLYDIGKSKNIYTEEYADSDRKRFYLPEDNNYANEGTKITMHFLIVGDAESRQTTLQNFLDYVRIGVHRYWDTARQREFDFIVTDEIKISGEKWHGSNPYIELSLPMQNIYGKTWQHTETKPRPPIVPSIYTVERKEQAQESTTTPVTSDS